MQITIEPDQLLEQLNADGEFRIAARFWTGAIQLQFGETSYVLRLIEGTAISVTLGRVTGATGEVILRAPLTDWYQFLQPVPLPLYHDLYPAFRHHGFELDGDADYLWPYYPALRRLGELVRAAAIIEEV